VDGILNDVMGVHGLFEAAGDALHGGAAACGEKAGGGVGARAAEGKAVQPLPLVLGQIPILRLSFSHPLLGWRTGPVHEKGKERSDSLGNRSGERATRESQVGVCGGGGGGEQRSTTTGS
jgi:hypothetical protein